VVVVSLKFRTVGGVIGVFLLGLLADFASGQFIGPNAAGSIVVFGLVGAIATRVYADRSTALMVIVFICSLAKSSALLLMYLFFLQGALGEYLQTVVLKTLVLEAVLSAAVAPIVLKLLLLGKPFPAVFRSPSSAAFR